MPHHGCIWFLCRESMGECQVCCRVWADSACIKHLWQRFSQWIDPKPNDLNATLGRERLNDVEVLSCKILVYKEDTHYSIYLESVCF